MIDQHIEYLLLNHTCVIVPGFGGFVVHRIPASYDKSDGMMLPPSTIVGFNPDLNINDSLLIQSFVEAYDMSYPEAQREVEHEVEELKGLIADNGSFDIHSVGSLSVNADGNYIFEPYKTGILVPQLYALSGIDTNDSDTFLPLARDMKADLAPSTPEAEQESDDSQEKVIRISTSTIKKIAAACIALVIIAAIPFIGLQPDTQRMLSGFDTSFFSQFIPQEEVKPEPAKQTFHVYVKKQTQPATSKEVPSLEKDCNLESTSAAHEFTVVLASMVSQKNADYFVKQLQARGIQDVRVIGEDKSRKVVAGTFPSEEEAQISKRILSQQKDLATAWVMEIK